MRDWTYRAAQALASDNLALGHDVIADYVNDWQDARDGWRDAAGRVGARVVRLEILCSDAAEHRRGVETRTSDIPGLAPPNWDAVGSRDYHPWDRDHLDRSIAIKRARALALSALGRVVDRAHRHLTAASV